MKQFHMTMKARLRARQGTSQYFRSCFKNHSFRFSATALCPVPLKGVRKAIDLKFNLSPLNRSQKCYIGGLGPFFLLFYCSQYGLTYLILISNCGNISGDITMASASDLYRLYGYYFPASPSRLRSKSAQSRLPSSLPKLRPALEDQGPVSIGPQSRETSPNSSNPSPTKDRSSPVLNIPAFACSNLSS